MRGSRKSLRALQSLDLYGVPGQVRTANLPLRRGMLYPIELLRQTNATARRHVMGVHVNQHARVCHVIHRFFCAGSQIEEKNL